MSNELLPVEILQQILQDSDVTDLCAAAAVCKHWKTAARVDFLWKEKFFSRWDPYFESIGNRDLSDEYAATNFLWSNFKIMCLTFLCWKKFLLFVHSYDGTSSAVLWREFCKSSLERAAVAATHDDSCSSDKCRSHRYGW